MSEKSMYSADRHIMTISNTSLLHDDDDNDDDDDDDDSVC